MPIESNNITRPFKLSSNPPLFVNVDIFYVNLSIFHHANDSRYNMSGKLKLISNTPSIFSPHLFKHVMPPTYHYYPRDT
jgi:hypothetical protein